MFKVDFFEFYTLLERYLVLCLSTFGVHIGADRPKTNVNALRLEINPEYAKRRPEASHQFHMNLLEALDDVKNPLHAALGEQDVRIQLGLAKDFRNRWKDADEKIGSSGLSDEDQGRKPIILDQAALEHMLGTILAGCDHALALVLGKVHNPSVRPVYSQSSGYSGDVMNIEDIPLEYMDDEMELD